jgi:hypothetical protein
MVYLRVQDDRGLHPAKSQRVVQLPYGDAPDRYKDFRQWVRVDIGRGSYGCKGICKTFPEYTGLQTLKARFLFTFYSLGGKRCDKCQCMFREDLMTKSKPTKSKSSGRKIKGTYHMCLCCGFRLSNRPSTMKAKRRYNEFLALRRID